MILLIPCRVVLPRIMSTQLPINYFKYDTIRLCMSRVQMSSSSSAIMVKIMLKKASLNHHSYYCCMDICSYILNAKCDLALAGLYYLRA